MKKIFIVIICFIMTGCTVNYNYDIDTNIEKIELLDNNEQYGMDVKKSINEIIDINGDETSLIGYYTFNPVIGNNESGISLKYTYNNFFDYRLYSQFLKCYDFSNSSVTENNVNINITSIISCDEKFDNANITLLVKGKLIETNADIVNNNSYTWMVQNNSDKDIILNVNRKIESKSANYTTILIIFIGITFAIVIITAIILVRKKNKNNAI